MTEQTTPAASDMSPDAPCRALIAPCGCLVGGDITMSGPGFCRTRAEADEDAARGYREEVRTVAEFRAARLCGDATWHTPGDAPRATTGPSPTVAAPRPGVSDVPDRLECEVARLHELAGEPRGPAAALKAENARLVEEATVSAALLEIEIAKREAAEMRANRATADLDALESEDRRQDVQAKHWREVLRIRRELDGIRQEMNDATEIIAKALGYRPSGLPLDGWPHLSTTGDHTPTSLAAEAAGVLAKASRLRAGIEALAAEMQSDTCPACHAFYADEGSTTWGCDHTEGMQHAGDMLRALLAEGGE